MSEIHLRQIKSYLQKTFNGLIDLADYQNKSETDKESIFLTRSLAAFALMNLADISPQEASKSIVDGGQDNGIDSIYFDKREKVMYVLQSKWKHESRGGIKSEEVMKFAKGFRDLVNARYDRFNSKLNNKIKDIEESLNDAGTRFEVILVYSGQTSLADEPKREIDDLLNEMNDPIDLVSNRIFNQSDIYNIISQGAKGYPINLDVCLFDWGQTKEPYKSYYGQVSAREVADWWTKHSPRLFSSNIRFFLRYSEVNDVAFAVRVKDKISSLWENIEKAPYKILFNASINGSELWKLVQILRIVDNKLSQ